MKNAMSIRMPEYIKHTLTDVCKKEHISLNQFIMTAIAEKLSALKTADIIEQRASKGSKEKFLQALAKVPNVQADEMDRLIG
jgi:hypothetical protein